MPAHDIDVETSTPGTPPPAAHDQTEDPHRKHSLDDALGRRPSKHGTRPATGFPFRLNPAEEPRPIGSA